MRHGMLLDGTGGTELYHYDEKKARMVCRPSAERTEESVLSVPVPSISRAGRGRHRDEDRNNGQIGE